MKKDRGDQFKTAHARKLLTTHEPGQWAYLLTEIGLEGNPDSEALVDTAYQELVACGYMEPADGTSIGPSMPYHGGVPKRPFRLTDKGLKAEDRVAREKEMFFSTGTQYYAAARFSYFARSHPVTGNQFHHAIERFIKGQLTAVKTLTELDREFKHRLTDLWAYYKTQISDSFLGRFDSVIEELDKFDEVRYPDSIVAGGMQSTMGPGAGNSKVYASGRQIDYEGPPTETRPEPVYALDTDALDELVVILFEKASINPKFMASQLSDEGRKSLVRDNKYAAKWQ